MSENKPIDLEAIRAENKIAQETLSHLCHEKWAGRDGWHWEIPANPSRDTDLQLGASIQSSNKLCDEVESLRQRVRELEGNEEYRPLIAGEQILPSDECFANNTGPWKPMAKGIIEIYCPWNGNSGVHVPIRRKIPTPTEGAKE